MLLLLLLFQGATSTSTASSASLSLNATVSGLGPAFKLTLELCNNGSQPILGAALVSPCFEHASHTMHPCAVTMSHGCLKKLKKKAKQQLL